jgi:hypothetical protein
VLDASVKRECKMEESGREWKRTKENERKQGFIHSFTPNSKSIELDTDVQNARNARNARNTQNVRNTRNKSNN